MKLKPAISYLQSPAAEIKRVRQKQQVSPPGEWERWLIELSVPRT